MAASQPPSKGASSAAEGATSSASYEADTVLEVLGIRSHSIRQSVEEQLAAQRRKSKEDELTAVLSRCMEHSNGGRMTVADRQDSTVLSATQHDGSRAAHGWQLRPSSYLAAHCLGRLCTLTVVSFVTAAS